MSFLNVPISNVVKSRRVPNAFMLFVKEQKKILKQNCPEASKSVLGTFLGKKWRSLTSEEKQIYYNKYNNLKKLEIESYDFRSVKDEEQVKSKNILKFEVNEMKTGSCSNPVQLDSGTRIETDSKNKKSEEISDVLGNGVNFEPYKMDIIPSPTTGNGISKQKTFKKVRRTPNAFMLFAKEQRYSLDPVFLRETKCHANTALGNMWKNLPASKKEKYKMEARNLYNMQRNEGFANMSNELEKGVKKKKKRTSKKNPKRPVGRPSKKPKNDNLVATPLDSRTFDPVTAEKKPESDIIKRTGKIESSDTTQTVTQPQNSNDQPNASHHRHSSIVASHFHHIPTPMDSQHYAFCNGRRPESTDTSNCNTSFKQFPASDTNIARSCFSSGNGYSPSLFPAYPFNSSYPFTTSPFWMYPHTMPYMPFFPPSSISQSLCNCAFPYPTYPNAYFSSFIAGISERCNGLFAGTSNLGSSSATAHNSSNKNESGEGSNHDHSGDELLIIDEDSEGNKPLESETSHCR